MPRFLSLIIPSTFWGFAWLTARSGERHVSLRLQPIADSHAHGRVELEEEPRGGTYVNVEVHGLEPGSEYVAEFHQEHGVHPESEGERHEVARFAADDHGNAIFKARLQEAIADIGSVDVRQRLDLAIVGAAAVE